MGKSERSKGVRGEALTESAFMQQIIDTARLLGWKVAHFRPAQTKDGWRTPVAADAKGWPDLCLVRDRIVWIEVKAEVGRVSPEQADWVAAITAAGGTALVVRPSMWDEIVAALKRDTRREAA